MRKVHKKDAPVQMLPIEFRREVEVNEKFNFSQLFESLKISSQDGRNNKLVGFEQIILNFYAITDGIVVEQTVKIPEIKNPVTQRKEGNILNFFFPYIFKDDESENCIFEIISGTGVIHFMGVGIVEISNITLLGE